MVKKDLVKEKVFKSESDSSSSFSHNLQCRRQEERGLQKFHSFVLVSDFKQDIAKMRHQVSTVKGDANEIADHW